MAHQFFETFSAAQKGTEKNSENQQLADEFHKPIIRQFRKCKVCLYFKHNIWGAVLANM